MVNADRISEVYKGEIWTTSQQQRARDRIDWLVGHATGDVLDVGCSQGIAALLVARARTDGQVVGVDNEPDRLVYASADRAREPAEVAARVTFLAASGSALPFARERFDTVLLGEVLEHLEKPDEVLAEVGRVLRPGGVVAITVPFGLSPHHDHRQTFYAADLLDTVATHLAPTSIDLVDRYLRLTATLGDADTARRAQLLAAVQPSADRVLLDVERAELAARAERQQLDLLSHELALRSRALERREREVARLRTALERAEARLVSLGARQRELVHQRDRWRWQFVSLRNRRAVRALVDVRRAVRSPRNMLSLPLHLVRTLLGPSPPAVPRPQQVDVADRTPSRQAPAEQRRRLELEMRMLAPPPPVTLRDLRVAAVLDTFSESGFGPECDLVTFRPDNWEAVLTQQPPHVLLVESAWKGGGGAWQYQVGTYSHAESVGLPHLQALIRWCRGRQIPTVFWNKEDPVHFGRFTQAAQLFDVVLTTDADCVERYRSLPNLRAGAVDALPFAAQPTLHNPVVLEPRDAVPVFAGTYYRNRHPQRRAQLELLLDAARPLGLAIFDRTFGEQDDGVGFPERFAPHIRGGLPYDEMVAAYRRYRVFLNANSVSASPTMFSRRVFELLACGTPVVSTPSVGMDHLFGDIVAAVDSAAAARAEIQRLLTDDRHWETRSAAGLRRVHGQHTYAHRLSTLAGLAGYAIPAFGDERVAVCVLGDGVSAQAIDAIVSQSQRPHEVLVGAAGGAPVPAGVTAVGQDAARPRSERLAELAATTSAPWVLIAGVGQTYGLDHLADLAVARRWTAADIIGVGTDTDRADSPLAHRHVRRVAPDGALVRRALVAEHGWDDRDGGATQGRLAALGATFYAVRA